MASKYRLFSADSHLEISPERWTERVPAKYRDRAPRLVKLPNGGDGIIIEGRPLYVVGLAIAGKPYERHELTGVNYAGSEGAGTPEQRLKEQDQDGVDGEILYTSAGNLSFWRGIKNDDAYLATIHAYNTFLAEEYCAANRDRLIALGALPTHSLDAAIKELEYCAKAGLKGMMVNTFPSGKSYPTLEDDRFYAAALDLNMPLSVHVGMQLPDGPLFKYEKDPGEVAFGGDPIRVLTRFGGNSGLNAVQLLLSGVFDRQSQTENLLGGNPGRLAALFLRPARRRLQTQQALDGALFRSKAIEKTTERLFSRAFLLGVHLRSHRHASAPRYRR